MQPDIKGFLHLLVSNSGYPNKKIKHDPNLSSGNVNAKSI